MKKYVIYAMIAREKKYIIKFTRKQYDGKIQPFYDTDKSLAEPFDSEKQANDFISQINNVHHREFIVETMDAQ